MAEKLSKDNPERFWRLVRNANAIGAAIFAAAGIALPQYESILFAGATINGLQAVGAEVIRQSRVKKLKTKPA